MIWNTEIAPAPSSPARRLLGGPPLTVLMRLVFVSLVVGAILMWLDVEPMMIVQGALRAVARLWAMGFAAFGEASRYVVAGAVLVVPVWIVLRLLALRSTR